MDQNLSKISLEEVKKNLNADERGLTSQEAQERLEKFGQNRIFQPPKFNWFKFFIDELKNPFIILLSISFLISLYFKYFKEAYLILFVILFQLILVYFHKIFSYKSLKSLYNFLKNTAVVKRDGKWTVIDSNFIVPGDVLRLSSGDQVPADSRILRSYDLSVNEAFLTGESLPVEKKNSDTLWAGSFVVSGEGEAIVFSTGKNTYFGKITSTIGEIKEKTWEEIWKIGKKILYFVLILSFAIFILALFEKIDLKETFLYIISIIVSAVPEGLPFAISVLIFFQVIKLYKRSVLTRNINAIENLGKIEVILTDKTGTITEGDFKYVGFYSSKKVSKDEENKILAFILSNLHPKSLFYNALKEHVQEVEITVKKKKPFDSKHKYSVNTFEFNNERYILVVGAPEYIIKNFNVKTSKKIFDEILSLTVQGNRLLGWAIKKINKNSKKKFFDNFGFLIFSDKIRESAKETISKLKDLNVDIFLVTGDFPETARNVAQKINLSDKVKDSFDLDFDCKVWARMKPEEKFMMVKELKRQSKKVLMIGDGINDAPAIKEADVGFSLNSGTDVAKDVSDFILMDGNLDNVAFSLKEGRKFIMAIKKLFLVIFTLSSDISILFFLSYLLNLPKPLYPNQVLFINIIEDTLLALFLIFNEDFSKFPSKKIFDKNLTKSFIFSLTVFLLISFFVYFFSLSKPNLKTIYFVYSLFAPLVLFLNIFRFEGKDKKTFIFAILWFLLFFLIFKIRFISEVLYLDNLGLNDLIFVLLTSLILGIAFKIGYNLKILEL